MQRQEETTEVGVAKDEDYEKAWPNMKTWLNACKTRPDSPEQASKKVEAEKWARARRTEGESNNVRSLKGELQSKERGDAAEASACPQRDERSGGGSSQRGVPFNSGMGRQRGAPRGNRHGMRRLSKRCTGKMRMMLRSIAMRRWPVESWRTTAKKPFCLHKTQKSCRVGWKSKSRSSTL